MLRYITVCNKNIANYEFHTYNKASQCILNFKKKQYKNFKYLFHIMTMHSGINKTSAANLSL